MIMRKLLGLVKSKSVYIVITLLLLLGFLFRLYKITNPIADWHSFRQADTASVSRVYSQEGINLLVPRYHDVSSIQSGLKNPMGYRFVEFPVFNLFHVLLFRITNLNFEVSGRLVSVISSLFSSFLIFLIGRKYLGMVGGIFSMFFFLVIPYNVYFTRVILPEPIATTFALLSIWLFIKHLDINSYKYFYLSALALSIAILIKPYTIFYFIPMLYLLYAKHGIEDILNNRNKLLIKILVYIALLITPFLIWRAWMNNYASGIPFFKWTFNGDNIRFHPAFWRWIFGERLGDMILGIWGTSLFVLGLVNYKKGFFIHSFLVGMFMYVSTFATANVKHDYYQVFIIPAVCLALGSGSIFIIKFINNKFIGYSVVGIIALLMITMSWFDIREFYKINHPEIIEAGQAVERLTPKDSLIIAPYNGDTAFLYQTNRWGWPAVEDSFENIIKRGADFYASVNLNDADTKYIEKNFEILLKTDKYLIADLHKPLKK